MNKYDSYKNRVLAKGSSRKDIIIHNKKRSFENYLKTAPNSYNVLINKVDQIVSIQDARFNYELSDDKHLLCSIDTPIKVGNYVEWDNSCWIVKSKESETIKDHQASRIGKCNHNLKWIDDSGALVSRQSIVSAKTLYTTGVKDEKVIQLPDGMVGIMLPYDIDTKLLKREQSFIFNKAKYKITFYNEVEYDGLIILICREETIDLSKDDIINEIADRYVNGEDRLGSVESNPGNASFYYTVSSDAKKNGDVYSVYQDDINRFTIHKFVSGKEVAGVFNFSIDNQNIATLFSITDNVADIYGIDRKTGNLTLKAVDMHNGVTVNINIKIVDWF